MIINRPITNGDIPLMEHALANSKFHTDQKVEYYTTDQVYSEMYEDEFGPIGVLRYTKALRLCTVWMDETDVKRNGEGIIKAIDNATAFAKKNGYQELMFQTNSPALARFCTRKLGFKESAGEYRKLV